MMTTPRNVQSRHRTTCLLALLVCSVGGQPAAAQAPERSERHRVPADFMSFRGAQWLEREARAEQEGGEGGGGTDRIFY